MNLPPYRPEIRFADIDAMGHVNNAVYFSYFEQARMHFFHHAVGDQWNWTEHGILVAHNEIDYKVPILLADRVDILLSCTHIGNASFTIAYSVEKQHGDRRVVCSTGKSVLVSFNYLRQTTQPIPQRWVDALKHIQVPQG
jgi:acyl-CoA thioester hydrolase